MSNIRTRSGMLWEVERILTECQQLGDLPQILLMENVPQVHGKGNKEYFEKWIKRLEELGYQNKWQDLNTKDYGIPQNRNRCFMISILRNNNFEFPPKKELKLKLKNLLEDEVDEKYYLSQKQVDRIKTTTYNVGKTRIQEKEYCDTLCARDYKDSKCVQVAQLPYFSYESDGRVYSPSGIAATLRAKEPNYKIDENDTILIKNNTKQGYLKAHDGDGCYIQNIDKKRGTVQKEMIPTLKTSPDIGVVVDSRNMKEKLCDELLEDNKVELYDVINHSYTNNRMTNWEQRGIDDANHFVYNNLRIRKLTPKECFRLQGVRDKDFENCARNQSNSSLYHLAGDSITVDVLMVIFSNLILNKQNAEHVVSVGDHVKNTQISIDELLEKL